VTLIGDLKLGGEIAQLDLVPRIELFYFDGCRTTKRSCHTFGGCSPTTASTCR
jgi:hypothetical protein